MENNDNEKKSKFHEALTYLVELSNKNAGIISADDVKNAFTDIIDDDSQYELIYNYLLENKITIQGYIKHESKNTNGNGHLNMSSNNDNMTTSVNSKAFSDINFDSAKVCNDSIADNDISPLDDKEKHIIEMYFHDIEASERLTDEEELGLLKDACTSGLNSNDSCLKKLTENKLAVVINIARVSKNQGVSFGDLLQEGNLGLIEGITDYINSVSDVSSVTLENYNSHIESFIKNAISDAINEQNSSHRLGSHVADRANQLDRISVELSKELGRTPSVEEIAEASALTPDEVERVMKMSLNALTVNNDIDETIDNGKQ